MKPILIRGSLAFVCDADVPRKVRWPNGIFLLRDGKPVEFNDLRTVGSMHTEAYGTLQNYTDRPE